jgi:hypothetical protein
MGKVVLIKLDDFATTKSTGGIVEAISEDNFANNYIYFSNKVNNKNYAIVKTDNDNVKMGWIYQDKTHVLRDPNS